MDGGFNTSLVCVDSSRTVLARAPQTLPFTFMLIAIYYYMYMYTVDGLGLAILDQISTM